VFGNGGQVAHGRGHVRRGEAIELVTHYPAYPPMSTRLFLAVDDDRIERLLTEGFKGSPMTPTPDEVLATVAVALGRAEFERRGRPEKVLPRHFQDARVVLEGLSWRLHQQGVGV